MPLHPTVERPGFDPAYGIPSDPPEGADWPAVEDKLAASRNYWIGTTRADGRPHAKPVWGIWHDGALWFGSAPDSVTGRNLARDPRVTVHLESGDDTVILEGVAETYPGGGVIPRGVVEQYGPKYDMHDELDQPETIWFRLAPAVAFTWLEHDFLKTAARWRFG